MGKLQIPKGNRLTPGAIIFMKRQTAVYERHDDRHIYGYTKSITGKRVELTWDLTGFCISCTGIRQPHRYNMVSKLEYRASLLKERCLPAVNLIGR